MPRNSLLLLLLLVLTRQSLARPMDVPPASTPAQALELLDKTALPDSSIFWPNIRLDEFITNLKANINFPLKIYQGVNTNFCGYAALSYLPLNEDPLAYTKFMLALYKD